MGTESQGDDLYQVFYARPDAGDVLVGSPTDENVPLTVVKKDGTRVLYDELHPTLRSGFINDALRAEEVMEIMPPADPEKKVYTEAQVQNLARAISEGAHYVRLKRMAARETRPGKPERLMDLMQGKLPNLTRLVAMVRGDLAVADFLRMIEGKVF